MTTCLLTGGYIGSLAQLNVNTMHAPYVLPAGDFLVGWG